MHWDAFCYLFHQNRMNYSLFHAFSYSHAGDGLVRTFREEGFRKLFSGIEWASSRAVLMTVGQLCFYDVVKQALMSTNYFSDNLVTHFTSSLCAVSFIIIFHILVFSIIIFLYFRHSFYHLNQALYWCMILLSRIWNNTILHHFQDNLTISTHQNKSKYWLIELHPWVSLHFFPLCFH